MSVTTTEKSRKGVQEERPSSTASSCELAAGIMYILLTSFINSIVYGSEWLLFVD